MTEKKPEYGAQESTEITLSSLACLNRKMSVKMACNSAIE